MSGPFGSSQLMYASGAEAFTLDQSLRFNDDDTPYLSFVQGAGNRRTFTFSAWIKLSSLLPSTSTSHPIVTWQNDSENSDWDQIRFLPSNWGGADKLEFILDGASDGQLLTNAVYRDTSAWMHILVAVDTTQGTDTNRAKLYVNGEQPSLDTATYPAENWDCWANKTGRKAIVGANIYAAPNRYFDGYMAEVHFIDGTALTPTSFGETGDYGEWKPIEVSGLTYGTNGFYLSFAGGGIIAATGGTITTDGDYKVHSFTADGTFTPSADGYVEYLIIGGGGGGGQEGGGPGGGAGGYLTGMIPVTASTAYSIVVGDGGAGGSANSSTRGANGEDSTAFGLTSTGGGGGYTNQNSIDGGGSGAGGSGNTARAGGSGTAGQGNDGGPGGDGTWYGGGGGGAGAVGGTPSGGGGDGGAGLASSITGSSVTRAGGGGGGTHQSGNTSSGGSGGGGAGGDFSCNDTAVDATANTGSGGGGAGGQRNVCGVPGGAGGSGIVIIRYKFQ